MQNRSKITQCTYLQLWLSLARDKSMWRALCTNAETLIQNMEEVRLMSEPMTLWRRWTLHVRTFKERTVTAGQIRQRKTQAWVRNVCLGWICVCLHKRKVRMHVFFHFSFMSCMCVFMHACM